MCVVFSTDDYVVAMERQNKIKWGRWYSVRPVSNTNKHFVTSDILFKLDLVTHFPWSIQFAELCIKWTVYDKNQASCPNPNGI